MDKLFQKLIPLFFCFPLILCAQESECAQKSECAPEPECNILRKSLFVAGPQYTHMKLHVHSTPTTPKQSFHGDLWGAFATYDFKDPWSIYFCINGSTVANSIYGPEKHHFREQNLEGRIGYVFAFDCPHLNFIPYTGFAYNCITQGHIGATHIKTSAKTYYVPIGIIAMYNFYQNFQVGLHLKYAPQVDTTVKFSSIKHSKWIIKRRDGFLVEVPFIYTYIWKFNCCEISTFVSIVPYWRILRKGPGTAVSMGEEIPIASLRYDFYGAKLLFGINF